MLADAARDAGAFVVGLSDSRAALLAARSDLLLVAATETAELGHSISALVSLSNVVVSGVAAADPERALERLRRIDAFYERFAITTDSM